MVDIDEIQPVVNANEEEQKQEEEKPRLEGKKLMVGAPCYAGQCQVAFAHSLILLSNLCISLGVPLRMQFLVNESLVQRGRNRIVSNFLESDCTHLMFIDSDLRFDPADVIRLLHHCEGDKKVIGGTYAKKSLNWERVTRSVQAGKTTPAELAVAAVDACFNFAPSALDPQNPNISLSEPLPVLDLPTGFMMVHRSVFEELMEKHPELKYTDDIEPARKTMHAFFDCYIHDDRYLSEDYGFVRRWQALGHAAYLCPWIATQHYGTHAYILDLPRLAETGVGF